MRIDIKHIVKNLHVPICKTSCRMLLIFLICSAHPKVFSQTGWFWQNPLPQGNDLFGVQTIDVNTVIAVGASGTVMKSTNRGSDWVIQQHVGGTYGILRSVSFASQDAGVIVGESGLILTTANGGGKWIKQSSSVNQTNLNYIRLVDAANGIAVGDKGTILKTTDGGFSWLSTYDGAKNNLWSVHFPIFGVGYAVGDSNTILKTIDLGTTWLRVDNSARRSLYSTYFVSQDSGWAVGSTGNIRRTVDGGSTWVSQVSNSSFNLYALTFANAHRAFSVGDTRLVYSVDRGNFWASDTLDTVNISRGIAFADTSVGWIVGSHGEIKGTMDGGTTWTSLTRGEQVDLNAISIPPHDRTSAFAAGEKGVILRTSDAGSNWTVMPTPISRSLRSIYFIASNAGIAVGDGGVIIKTIDGGNLWTSVQNTGSNLTSVNFSDGLHGWAVGFKGTVLQTTNAGLTWSMRSINGIDSTTTVSSVYFVDSVYGWMAIDFGLSHSYTKVLKTTDRGSTWNLSATDSSYGAISIFFINRNVGWAVGNSMIPRKTTDGGKNWSKQSPPFLQRISSFESIRFATANTGWIVGSNGAVCKTTDGGKNWFAQQSKTNNIIYGIAMLDSSVGWVVGANGTILKTLDGGGNAVVDTTPPVIVSQRTVRLLPNFPNPFCPLVLVNEGKEAVTYLAFELDKSSSVTFIIYDLLGHKIKELYRDGILRAGIYDRKEKGDPYHASKWDGTDENGKDVPSGVYFYSLVTPELRTTSKMVLIR